MRTWWLVFAVACSSAPAPAPAPVPVATGAPVVMIDAAPVAPPVDAGAAAEPAALDGGAAPVAATPPLEHPSLVKAPPVVKGKVTRITEGATKTVGGVKITMGSPSHKHAVRGAARGMWTFKLARGAAATEVELSSSQEGFEAEVVEHGVLFVFRHVSYGSFDIVHVAGKAPTQMTDDECGEKVDKAATDAKLPRGSGSSLSTDNGIAHHHEGAWIGHCGLYTKRLWFTAKPVSHGDDE